MKARTKIRKSYNTEDKDKCVIPGSEIIKAVVEGKQYLGISALPWITQLYATGDHLTSVSIVMHAKLFQLVNSNENKLIFMKQCYNINVTVRGILLPKAEAFHVG